MATALLAAGYRAAVARRRRTGRRWPRRRSLAGLGGTVLALAGATALTTPSFPLQIAGHLAIGMAAPLLIALSRPVTLALGAASPGPRRVVVGLLRSRPLGVLTEPAVAAVLDVGALWLLHRTGWGAQLHHRPALMLLVGVHMLVAGTLFTLVVLRIEPLPRRRGRPHRAVVLVLAVAAHDVLAKVVYAHAGPEPGMITTADRQLGAQLMYYGGDVVSVVMMLLLCTESAARARRRARRTGVFPGLPAG